MKQGRHWRPCFTEDLWGELPGSGASEIEFCTQCIGSREYYTFGGGRSVEVVGNGLKVPIGCQVRDVKLQLAAYLARPRHLETIRYPGVDVSPSASVDGFVYVGSEDLACCVDV